MAPANKGENCDSHKFKMAVIANFGNHLFNGLAYSAAQPLSGTFGTNCIMVGIHPIMFCKNPIMFGINPSILGKSPITVDTNQIMLDTYPIIILLVGTNAIIYVGKHNICWKANKC